MAIKLSPGSLFPWHNDTNPLDVNADKHVTSIDALLVINQINSHRGGPLPPGFYGR